MSEPNAVKKTEINSALEARFEQELNDLKIRHAQEIQKLSAASSQREKEFLKDCREEYQEQAKVLVGALLKVKLQRDRFLFAIGWIAVGILVFSVFRGLVHGAVAKALVLAALAGFIGTIVAVAGSFKRNGEHLKCINEGRLDHNPIWKEEDGASFRFLVFGFISTALLIWSLGLPSAAKVAVVAPAVQAAEQKPEVVAPLPPVNTSVVSAMAAPVPVENTGKPSIKTSGNGGNFSGGVVQKQ